MFVGLALLAFLLAEGSWRLLGRAQRLWAHIHEEPASSQDVFDHVPWGAQYKRDIQDYQWTDTFHPFVEFRPRPLHSETVNISHDGIRVTPYNDDPSDKRSLKVFLFGGSTMLGVGVPDWGTIPAYLSREYKQLGAPHEVVNYGTGWWTSSQSLAQLVILLREGNHPNKMIFYDGINDINVLSFGGRTGGISPEAEAILQRGFENKPQLIRDIVSHSALLKALVTTIYPNLRAKRALTTFAMTDPQIDLGAEEIVHAYENNVRMAGALAREYGFDSFFFWQPSPLIARKPRTEMDTAATSLRRHFRVGEDKLFEKVYALIRASEYLHSRGDFYDLQDIFATEERSVYGDSEHLLPEGNEAVARAIFDKVWNRH